jgi:hypothetical protein
LPCWIAISDRNVWIVMSDCHAGSPCRIAMSDRCVELQLEGMI